MPAWHAQQKVLQRDCREHAALGFAEADKNVVLQDAVRLGKRGREARLVEIPPTVTAQQGRSVGRTAAAALRGLGGYGAVAATVPPSVAQSGNQDLVRGEGGGSEGSTPLCTQSIK